jgi:hypothetical protein
MRRAALLLLLAAGCSGGAGAGTPLTPAHDAGGAEAQAAGAALQAALEASAGAYEPADAGSAFRSGDAFLPACVTASGTYVDGDLDRYPDTSLELTLAGCTVTGSSGGTLTLSGVETVLDTALGSRSLDFTETLALSLTLDPAGPSHATATWAGERDGTGSPVPTLHSAIHAVTDASAGGKSFHLIEDEDWSTVFTPTAAWMPGDPLVQGTIDVSGTWQVSADGRIAQTNVMTSAPLEVAAASLCSSRIVGGSASAEYLVEGATYGIDFTWRGCGDATVDWDTP